MFILFFQVRLPIEKMHDSFLLHIKNCKNDNTHYDERDDETDVTTTKAGTTHIIPDHGWETTKSKND